MADNATSLTSPASNRNSVTFPLHEEKLRVGIKTVDTGKGIRANKSIVEHPATINETLLHDEVEIQHVPSDQIFSLGEAPGTRYEGDTLIVPVLEEVLIVEKRVRLKEELHIIKKKREEHHSKIVQLKSEEISIEHFDEGANMQGNRS
jgi:uncharacterized protein (TIGR02271 family)